MTKSQQKNVAGPGLEPATPRFAVRLTSNCARWPGLARGVWLHSSLKLLLIKVTPDLHLTYSKNGVNLGLVLKMKNMACLSILLTKHVKYTYLYLFKFVLYSIHVAAFKAN